jgi:hypothetical protein
MEKTIPIPDWVQGTIVEEILTFEGALISPSEEIAEGEKEIGEMSYFEKVVLTLIEKKAKEVKKMRKEDPNPEDNQIDFNRDFDRKFFFVRKKLEVLRGILWGSIQPKFLSGSLGVRNGFKVVEITEEDSKEREILAMFLGL